MYALVGVLTGGIVRYYRSINLKLGFIWNCGDAVSICKLEKCQKLVVHNRG